MSELSFSDVIKRQQLDNGCIGDPAPGECAAFKVLSACVSHFGALSGLTLCDLSLLPRLLQNGLFRSGLAAATRHYLREARVAIRERKQLKAPTVRGAAQRAPL